MVADVAAGFCELFSRRRRRHDPGPAVFSQGQGVASGPEVYLLQVQVELDRCCVGCIVIIWTESSCLCLEKLLFLSLPLFQEEHRLYNPTLRATTPHLQR